MPYNLQYTVEVKNGSLIIPHYDHYHNIKFEWFDEGLYEAPKGYTLEDLLATVKYYVEHPNERPHSDNGLVTLATMFKETKMVKLIPIKRKNQARRNLRQKNLRKKPSRRETAKRETRVSKPTEEPRRITRGIRRTSGRD